MTDTRTLRGARHLSRLIAFNRPASRWSLASMHGRTTCLLYHRIARHTDRPWLEACGVPCTTPEAFRRQMQELRRLNAEFFTFDDLEAGMTPAANRPGIVVTFDDGFRDSFEAGADVLEEMEIPAVFFVTASLPERRTLLWEHLLFWTTTHMEALRQVNSIAERRLGKRIPLERTVRTVQALLTPDDADKTLAECASEAPAAIETVKGLYADWDQIRKARVKGHQIGAHSATHRMRHVLTVSEFRREIDEAKEWLESELREPVTAMAYPYNSYFIGDDDLCRDAAYRQVATVDPGRVTASTSRMWLPRRTVFRAHDSLMRFRELLAQEGFLRSS